MAPRAQRIPQELLDEEFRKVRVSVARLEETLSKQDYLVESGFSLADICNFAIANGLDRPGGWFTDFVNEKEHAGLLKNRTDEVTLKLLCSLPFQPVETNPLLFCDRFPK